MNGHPPPDLRARILAQARATPSPTANERRRRTYVAEGLAACASVLFAWRFGPPATRSAEVLTAIAVGGALSALFVTWVALSRGGSMLGRSRGALAGIAVVAPLVLLGWATAVARWEGSLVVVGGTLHENVVCVACTLLFALGPFAAFAYARRGTDPVHPRVLGAALGAAAGAWGGTMIELHCKVTAVSHMAIGHALPIVAISALGALLGVRVFGVKRS